MDEILKAVVTKVAEHIARLVDNNEGRAIALTEQTYDYLLQEVRRIADEAQKGRTG